MISCAFATDKHWSLSVCSPASDLHQWALNPQPLTSQMSILTAAPSDFHLDHFMGIYWSQVGNDIRSCQSYANVHGKESNAFALSAGSLFLVCNDQQRLPVPNF
ncbi:hypothetical protein ACTXT7_011811 [Hymenolepis weldensis]